MINTLAKDEFLTTMGQPMRFIDDEDDECPAVPIGDYLRECIAGEGIPTDADSVEIHAVYATPGNKYCHILLTWGVPNVFLVIVTQPREQHVNGHYLLDLNGEYGLYDARDEN